MVEILLDVGEVWKWTMNSREFPNDPDYNYFLVMSVDNLMRNVQVMYLKNSRVVNYTADTFTENMRHLQKIA